MTHVHPTDLGFIEIGPNRWRRHVRGRDVVFHAPTTLADVRPLEEMQREVMGVTDLDVIPASGLIVVPETGGAVLVAEIDGEPAAALWGFGGFVDGRPRIVSDWMGVRVPFRSLGLGADLKRLQAVLALAAGFAEIVWTVDPLRAANARLNVAKLGATSRSYEVDRYGPYAEGLYGAMPTDRLHIEWDLHHPTVRARLRGDPPPEPDLDPIPTLAAETIGQPRLLVPIPADIDALVRTDPHVALGWRLRVREQLQAAFAAGYVVDDFRPTTDAGTPAHVLTRREPR